MDSVELAKLRPLIHLFNEKRISPLLQVTAGKLPSCSMTQASSAEEARRLVGDDPSVAFASKLWEAGFEGFVLFIRS